jgi:hypothetical protein
MVARLAEVTRKVRLQHSPRRLHSGNFTRTKCGLPRRLNKYYKTYTRPSGAVYRRAKEYEIQCSYVVGGEYRLGICQPR